MEAAGRTLFCFLHRSNPAVSFARFHGISHQHGNGHRSHTAGYWGNFAGHLPGELKIHIPDQFFALPLSVVPIQFTPTSITVALARIISPVTARGCPAGCNDQNLRPAGVQQPDRVSWCGEIVTKSRFHPAVSATSITAIGFPTMLLRPTTTDLTRPGRRPRAH